MFALSIEVGAWGVTVTTPGWATKDAGISTVQTGIFPENKPGQSIGFRAVGRRERLGLLNGVWPDVVLMEHLSRFCSRKAKMLEWSTAATG